VTPPFNSWLAVWLFTLPEFPSILFRSKVIQEFRAFAMVKKFFQFWEANMTPKIFFANLDTPKGTSLRKSASIEALWSRWLFPFGL
jgi:hypothetical protein